MIKLYDFKSSPNCQRVKVVLGGKESALRNRARRSHQERTEKPGLFKDESLRQSAGADRRLHGAL